MVEKEEKIIKVSFANPLIEGIEFGAGFILVSGGAFLVLAVLKVFFGVMI